MKTYNSTQETWIAQDQKNDENDYDLEHLLHTGSFRGHAERA